ncbi:YqjK-like family protein [Enterobacteriaceae bacterium LUAb1]
MSKSDREACKAQLLGQISQQRKDLSKASHDWLVVTAPYDHSWLTLYRLRRWITLGSSVIAIWSTRHPRKSIHWLRKSFKIWGIWRLVRHSLFNRAR